MSHPAKTASDRPTTLTHAHVLAASFFLLPLAVVFAPVQTSALLIVASVGTLCTWLWCERRAPPIHRHLALGVTALVVFGSLSGFWAIEMIPALKLALRLALLSIAGVVLCGVVQTLAAQQRHIVAKAALLGTALALGLLYYDLWGKGAVQIGIFGETQADYGRTVSLLAVMVWSLLVQSPIRTRPILGIGLVGLIAGILLSTPGFAAKVALLVGLATLFFAWRFRAGFSKLVFALIAAAFLLGPTMARKFDHPNYYRPLVAAESEFAQMRWTPALAHRLHMWGYATAQILEHPILGWGLDASRKIPGGSGPISPEDLGFSRLDLSENAAGWLDRGSAQHLSLHPHNATLQIWLELGLVGALLAGGLVIFMVNAAVHHHHPAGLALCLSALVVANFSYGVWQNWWLAALWLVAALYLNGIKTDTADEMPRASTLTAP